MAETVTMRVGESKHLRGPVGEVARWTSSSPLVATVADEDIVHGRAGGQVVARSVGRSRIRAHGFDDTVLVEVEIAVQGSPIIRVAAGERTAIPGGGGPGGWSVDNPQVARMLPSAELQGVAPGIALLRGGDTEHRVEVTGSLDSEVDSTLDLRPRFSVPVRAWRTSSSAVSVSSSGRAATGDRARTVEITAELEDGSTFSFDLRVVARRAPAVTPRPEASSPPARQPSPRALEPALPPPAASPRFPPPALPAESTAPADLEDGQSQEVALHLQWAEVALGAGDWPTVRTQLSAAEIAASGHELLMERVRRAGDRLRARISAQAAGALQRVGTALVQSEFRLAERALAEVPAVSDWRGLVQSLQDLGRELESAASNTGEVDEGTGHLRQLLGNVWREASGTSQFSLLPLLGRIALNHTGVDMIPAIVRTLVDGPAAASCPISVREELESLLRDAGDAPLESALRLLSDRSTASEACNSLIALLPGLDLSRHGRAVIRFYAGLPEGAAPILVSRLTKLAEFSAGALFDLLAGVLQCLPADPRLAKAVQRQMGSERLEKEAVKWAARNHAGARTVLRRLYEYSASAFPGR
jgi:hypothetical protein